MARGFGERLKLLRTERRMTQGELGALLGLSQETITNYERGGRFPRPRTLQSIARLFGLSLDELLGTALPARRFPGAAPETGKAGASFEAEGFLAALRQDGSEAAYRYGKAWRGSNGLGLAEFFEAALLPVLARIGGLWQEGSMSVADEHLLSEKIRETALRIANDASLPLTATAAPQPRWLGFCAPGEKHELALLFHYLALRQAGWSARYLGTQLPLGDALGAIEAFRPQVVGISATMDEHVEALEAVVKGIRARFGSSPAIILGGQASFRQKGRLSGMVEGCTLSISEGISLSEKYLA